MTTLLTNPLRVGLRQERVITPQCIVIFGASGDLTLGSGVAIRGSSGLATLSSGASKSGASGALLLRHR